MNVPARNDLELVIEDLDAKRTGPRRYHREKKCRGIAVICEAGRQLIP